jgi:hypothetical protein
MGYSLYPLSVAGRVFVALKQRIQYYADPQFCALAVEITDTTPGAQHCPTCWDSLRWVPTDPACPTCLGTGWLVPASTTTPQQGGYLLAVPFDAVVVPAQEHETLTISGTVQYSGGHMVIWPRTNPLPKKGDVLIVTTPRLLATSRYVFADVQTPETLGFQTFIYTGELEGRQHDSIIYSIPPVDITGLSPGTWS